MKILKFTDRKNHATFYVEGFIIIYKSQFVVHVAWLVLATSFSVPQDPASLTLQMWNSNFISCNLHSNLLEKLVLPTETVHHLLHLPVTHP